MEDEREQLQKRVERLKRRVCIDNSHKSFCCCSLDLINVQTLFVDCVGYKCAGQRANVVGMP